MLQMGPQHPLAHEEPRPLLPLGSVSAGTGNGGGWACELGLGVDQGKLDNRIFRHM